ncbi:survival factor 1 protein [Trichophyton equinum CBS 127.97]|uniref:Survival factor 1 protein n=1 Tax=Trichophyton equinum (strain ATCC MYA-4606 / CBS 127.97) TaxID=559882 RepID=F2PUR6_TRIEC|nr:survival factor 1 protein [Trichophyton equinum CBS 127.97]
MNWFKQTLANVAGTQEPIYGPTAIQSVVDQAKTIPYTEVNKDHLRWAAMQSTCVETQTFYLFSDNGDVASLQLIYNNVVWNFVDFQSPTFSAGMMEYTTPPSYGSTVVNVGGVAKDGEVIYAGAPNSITHTEATQDSENDWPEPTALKITWSGKTAGGKPFEAIIEGSLGQRMDRIDVMAEVPGLIKSLVGSVAGTRPYVYQFIPSHKLPIKIKVGDDEEITEEGTLLMEATFIS